MQDMFRFLHASDLHLGKPFGGFPEDVRGRLRRARHEALDRLAAAARGAGADTILLAGDTFDAQTPQPTTIRHALNAMRAADDLTWVMLPGNHDSLAATELWRVLAQDRPANLRLAIAPAPLDLGGAVLLPAPCPVRDPGRDLTEWMDGAATGERPRIGLAHGPIRDFRPADEAPAAGVIAPDRARRAGLDYLALGDWHGRIEVSPGTWYSGAPEPDSFKPHRAAGALAVSLDGAGAGAEMREVETGALAWQRIALDAFAGEDVAALLEGSLPPLGRRADTLLSVVATGRMRLPERLALQTALARGAPDFLWHEADLDGLALAQDEADLDLIDRAGALRGAAETLAREIADAPDLAARDAAAGALARLYGYAVEEA